MDEHKIDLQLLNVMQQNRRSAPVPQRDKASQRKKAPQRDKAPRQNKEKQQGKQPARNRKASGQKTKASDSERTQARTSGTKAGVKKSPVGKKSSNRRSRKR
jgi:hypothetical protein